jgi:hypothetical protein
MQLHNSWLSQLIDINSSEIFDSLSSDIVRESFKQCELRYKSTSHNWTSIDSFSLISVHFCSTCSSSSNNNNNNNNNNNYYYYYYYYYYNNDNIGTLHPRTGH